MDPLAPDALLAIADEGLGDGRHAIAPDVFTARLLAQRGRILERLGRDDEALDTYEEALDMNAVLVDRALQEAW